MKTTIALVAGDTCGIGPELLAKLLTKDETQTEANHIIVADKRVIHQGMQIAKTTFDYEEINSLEHLDFSKHHTLFYDTQKMDPARVPMSQESADAGRVVMEELTIALDLVQAKKAHAVCFMPLNKKAMNMGGYEYEDELAYFDKHLKNPHYYGEINALKDLWTSRATSHIAFKDIIESLTPESIYQPIKLLYTSLQKAGYGKPKIFVAALNPHAGDNGLHGDEERELLTPVIQQATTDGYPCEGPYPADTIFLKAQKEKANGVVTMYHDQGQIAIKLMGFDRGVTIHGGFEVPICTPAHGTAFDIAGKGIADVGATLEAYKIAVNMGKTRATQNQN